MIKHKQVLALLFNLLGWGALLLSIYLTNRALLLLKIHEILGPLAANILSYLYLMAAICLPVGMAYLGLCLTKVQLKGYLAVLCLLDLLLFAINLSVFYTGFGQGLINWLHTGGYVLWAALHTPIGVLLGKVVGETSTD